MSFTSGEVQCYNDSCGGILIPPAFKPGFVPENLPEADKSYSLPVFHKLLNRLIRSSSAQRLFRHKHMSRIAQRNGAAEKSVDEGGELRDHMANLSIRNARSTDMDVDEECPVCHSRRYLNKYIKFLVNPECYHKLCNSCVDRLFAHGPAPCPIAGCGKTLRKNRFRTPTFGDLQLEREVDIRRKVSQV
jgi:hypothetical protein